MLPQSPGQPPSSSLAEVGSRLPLSPSPTLLDASPTFSRYPRCRCLISGQSRKSWATFPRSPQTHRSSLRKRKGLLGLSSVKKGYRCIPGLYRRPPWTTGSALHLSSFPLRRCFRNSNALHPSWAITPPSWRPLIGLVI